MKALDPALEPKEVVRAAPAKGGDLIFLDVNYDEPSRPITSSAPVVAPEKAKTQWTVEHPTTPSATAAVAIEMPKIVSDEDILIDLESAQSSDVVPLSGLSHGALLPDGGSSGDEDIVSNVDVAFITGFEESTGASETSGEEVAPLEGLEPSSHLELAEPEALSPSVDSPSMLAGIELESAPMLEPQSPEIENVTPSGGELPMLDVPFDDADDDGATVGGSLTFLSIDSHAEISPLPEIEAQEEFAPTYEPAAETPLIVEPMESHASELEAGLASEPASPFSSLRDDFGDLSLDVERSPTLEMDVVVPDGGPPLPMLDLDDAASVTFDREHALAGLPMLDADEPTPASARAEHTQKESQPDEEETEEDDTVELVWQTEAADVPLPIVPLEPRVPSQTPIPAASSAPALGRTEQLRLDVGARTSRMGPAPPTRRGIARAGRQARWDCRARGDDVRLRA